NTITVHVGATLGIDRSTCRFVPPTSFRLQADVMLGQRYVMLRSVDSTTWTAISTNTATTNPFVFVDEAASTSQGFYRLGVVIQSLSQSLAAERKENQSPKRGGIMPMNSSECLGL